MVDKSKFLKELGLEDINQGSCTGANWIKSKGKTRKVSSPVDGKIILLLLKVIIRYMRK